MFDAYRKAHIARGHAGRQLLFGTELLVRSGRGMDGQRPGVADIGDVIDEFKRVDEGLPSRCASIRLWLPPPQPKL